MPYAPDRTDRPTRKVTQEVRLAGSLWERADWLAGGFYTSENSEHQHVDFLAESATGNIVGTLYSFSNPYNYQEYAGFADVTYHFTDRLNIQLGGRESHYTLGPTYRASANVFTYLVTPQFKFSSDVMTYARLASGYRPGQPNTGFLPPGVPAMSAPDTTKNYELGLKGSFFEHRLVVDTSIFYIDWNDIQNTVNVTSGPFKGFPYVTNAGGAKSTGAEVSVTVRPDNGLTLSGWVDYDDAALTKAFPSGSAAYGVPGSELPLSSKWSGYLSAQQEFPLAESVTGFVGADANYVDRRLDVFSSSASVPRQAYPAYTKFDVRAGVSYEGWRLSAYVNNLTDRRAIIGGGRRNSRRTRLST